MQHCSILTVSSPFRFKTLLTKPLKYIIQIFTGDSSEHIAKLLNQKITNVSGVGLRIMGLEEWLDEYSQNGARIHKYTCPASLTDYQVKKIEEFDESCKNKKYGAFNAAWTFADDLTKTNIKFNSIVCSQQAFDSLVAGGLFPPQKDTLTPAELKKKLIKAGWKKQRIYAN